ncbi:MAG TPA: HD domain-containing protein [Candidatus Eremiobacteraeota bacterium]|nr:HD domain-containing protein [Candidatus Eremiobacteraeota bacterium]
MNNRLYGQHKIQKLLKELERRRINGWVIDTLEKDLDYEENEKILLEYIETSLFREKIIKAMEISKKAHTGQTQKRSQDEEGLDNIPYFNHPVQVALMACRKNLSPEAIQASLLHDVVEDTHWSPKDLEKEGMEQKTLNIVANLTKDPQEDRRAYLNRVKNLTGEAKLIKCFDRYHNILRSFSLKDIKFLNRYIVESEEIYLPAFAKYEELSDMKIYFNILLQEIKKFRDSLLF